MFFRLFKGYEIWGLVVLLLISFAYTWQTVGEAWFNQTSYTIYYEDESTEELIGRDEIRKNCFENSGISVYDVYRYSVETIPQDAYDEMSSERSFIREEFSVLFNALSNMSIFPSIIIGIFIPVFYGRMFSDGTVKNLISCGHSRGKIYLSSLIVTLIIDTLMIIASLINLVIVCLWYRWQPPVYLPVVLPLVLISFLVLYTLSSVCIAVMFTSAKKTAGFIAAFLLVVSQISGAESVLPYIVYASHKTNTLGISEEYRDVLKEKGRNAMEQKLLLSEFDVRFYYEDNEVIDFGESSLPPAVKYTLITAYYLTPNVVVNNYRIYCFSPYMLQRDGIVAINTACNVLWILVSNSAGILVFRKREFN